MMVEPGELRAVIGPNGAGKTTFFNLISGFATPTSGRIVFDGEDITKLLPDRAGVARHVAHLPDHRGLSGTDGWRKSAVRGRGRRGLPPALRLSRGGEAEVHERIAEFLEMGGLTGKASALVGELSHGDQRATEIMMALALKPRLLLLDEPTAGMGDQETYDITQLIRKLHKNENLTIVLIEHDMRVVFHLADRIMVLAEGSHAGRRHARRDRHQRSRAGGLSRKAAA